MEGLWIVLFVLGLASAITFTVLAYMFVLSRDKKAIENSPFLNLVYELLNIRELYIEKIWHFLYVWSMMVTISSGIWLIPLGWTSDYDGGVSWIGYIGLIILAFGPIVIRIVYEMSMLLPLCVKHLMRIDQKLENIAHGNLGDIEGIDVEGVAEQVDAVEEESYVTSESEANATEPDAIIAAHCETCKGKMRIKASMAWGHVVCPHCKQTVIAVPEE